MNSYTLWGSLDTKTNQKSQGFKYVFQKKRRTHHLKLITLNKNTSKAKAFKVFEFPLLN